MLYRHLGKLTKIRHFVCVKNTQDFSTANKLMDRVPRNIKNCDTLRPRHIPVSSEDVEPRAITDTSFAWGQNDAPSVNPFNLFNMKKWWEYKKRLYCERDQKYDFVMMNTLGTNIAATNFVLQWNGRVKLQNHGWLENAGEKPIRLPSSYTPNYIVVAIDASNTDITYEGLKNMTPLTHLNWLSFKGCPFIDDWCIDKIAAHYPSLEYLDISQCKNVTERGLEALYKLFNLKTLIVTNHHKSAAFELTCLMLEDSNPDLKCQILNSKYSNDHEESHEKT